MTQHSDQSTTQSTNTPSQAKKPRRFRPRRMTVVMSVTIVLIIVCMAALAFFYQAKRDTKELMRTQTVMGDVLARAADYSSGKAISWDNYAMGSVSGVIATQAEREQLLAKNPFVNCPGQCDGWLSVADAKRRDQTIDEGFSLSPSTEEGVFLQYVREVLQDPSTKCALWNHGPVQKLCISPKTGRYVYNVSGHARGLYE